MIAKVFVPAAALVTIATVGAPMSSGLIALFVGIGSLAVVSEPIEKRASAARVAVTNPASVQALEAYNKIRTGDMPIGVALEADILLTTVSVKQVVTFAGPTQCYRNDFIGIHVSNNGGRDWKFLGVGPRDIRLSFNNDVSGKVLIRITPLHYPLCSDAGRGPKGHYLIYTAGPLPVAAVAAEVQHTPEPAQPEDVAQVPEVQHVTAKPMRRAQR